MKWKRNGWGGLDSGPWEIRKSLDYGGYWLSRYKHEGQDASDKTVLHLLMPTQKSAKEVAAEADAWLQDLKRRYE